MKNINMSNLSNLLTKEEQFYKNVRRFTINDIMDGYTPIHDMVGSVRSFFVNYGYAPIARGVLKLNDKYSLSLVANAHDEDDEMESAAWLEIAVVKDGNALVDHMINLRYNDFLAVIRAVAKTNIRSVSNLVYQLVKYEQENYGFEKEAEKIALQFVGYVASN